MVKTRSHHNDGGSRKRLRTGIEEGSASDQEVLLGKQPEEQLGRGHRIRRMPQFLEDEYDDEPSFYRNERRTRVSTELFRSSRPQRTAAQRALEEIGKLEHSSRATSSEDEAKSQPPRNAERAARRTERGEEKSPELPDELVEESSEDSESDSSSGSSASARPRPNIGALMKKRLPINALMSKTLQTDARKSPVFARPKGGNAGKEDGDGDRNQLGDITPLQIDSSVNFQSVGGLPHHILTLREMVLIPLLYPALMKQLSIQPPRGVLFVGPPGTGKTLLARALANEGFVGGRRVTFFMRKGADILSKWVGESERQLRLLFDEARRLQPSIIFFDEIDGLAPVRHSKQEQSHAALVSTLLALMDGIDDRGQVIVIGATNRPDTIDPALRRPGRFDRELQFPVPDAAARRHILSIHMPASHVAPPAETAKDGDSALAFLVQQTEGWCGADLRALCTEASLVALRRSAPQIYVSPQRLVLDSCDVRVTFDDYRLAVRRLQPSLRRVVEPYALLVFDPFVELLVQTARIAIVERVEATWMPAVELKRDATRDCSDLEFAAAQLTAAPGPSPPSGFFTVLEATDPAFLGALLASVVAKSFPTFGSICVEMEDLPSVAPLAVTPMELQTPDGPRPCPEADTQSFAAIVSTAILRAPSVLVILGLEAWVEGRAGAEASDPVGIEVRSLRRHLERLAHQNVLVLIPVARPSSVAGSLPASAQVAVCTCSPTPPEADLASFFKALLDSMIVAQCTSIPPLRSWKELPVDDTPLPVVKEPLRDRIQRWKKVEYKRAQLRHCLRNWILLLTGNRAFALFLSPDLDLEGGDADALRAWRAHTRGRRIGLSEIAEKINNEEYHCLSAYNDDIEQLCNNVTSYFVTRDQASLKYRTRAKQLKEETLLHNHKINRHLVAFCEEAKDENEPSSEEDEPEGGNSGPRNNAAPEIPAQRKQKKRKRFYGERRRRRRPPPRPPTLDTPDPGARKSGSGNPEEQHEEESSEGEEGGEEAEEGEHSDDKQKKGSSRSTPEKSVVKGTDTARAAGDLAKLVLARKMSHRSLYAMYCSIVRDVNCQLQLGASPEAVADRTISEVTRSVTCFEVTTTPQRSARKSPKA